MAKGTRKQVSALAPWFGSNRTLAHHVGEALKGLEWVGVLFAGGMAEVPHIDARTIMVNDQHKHLLNLARVASHPRLGSRLVRILRRLPVHPNVLSYAQHRCERIESGEEFPTEDDMVEWAEHYFVCCWMSRSGAAGTSREFKASFVERWDAGGGDSALRFRSATEALRDWRRATARATFTCKDAFEMIARTKDKRRHGLYGDSPFPGAGRRYRHNAGKTDAEERKWHTRLRDGVQRFEQTRVVMRFYDHPLIRELYDPSRWDWKFLDGGKTQANETAPEVLLINRTEAK